jgi:glycyl-tRNA synthetase beta subunit
MATITANIKGADGKTDVRTIAAEYEFGKNLDEAVKLFGAGVVFEHFVDSATIALQAFMRGRMRLEGEKHQSDATIVEAVKTWKPSQRKPADPAKRAETVRKLTGSMTAEQRAALIAELQASLTPAPVPTTKKGKRA